MSEGANPPPGRRRRRMTKGPETLDEYPALDSWCDECSSLGKRERQRQSHSGTMCKFGHGGAAGIPFDGQDFEDQHGVNRDRRDDVPEDEMRIEEAGKVPTIVAREGDSLHIRFPEVTLPLRAKYASAKVGGLSMTRTLRVGEGVAEAGREMAVVLRELSLEIARSTINDFDGELEGARKRG